MKFAVPPSAQATFSRTMAGVLATSGLPSMKRTTTPRRTPVGLRKVTE